MYHRITINSFAKTPKMRRSALADTHEAAMLPVSILLPTIPLPKRPAGGGPRMTRMGADGLYRFRGQFVPADQTVGGEEPYPGGDHGHRFDPDWVV
jgi:hypothetical protein